MIDIRRNIYRPMQDMTFAAATHLVLPLHNDAATPTLAFGDGDTGFYQALDNAIAVSIGGNYTWQISASLFGSGASGQPALLRETVSATNPVLVPDKDDPDTGVGHAAADQLSLVAGGFEGLRLTESGNVVNMDIVCHEGAVVTHNDNVVTLN